MNVSLTLELERFIQDDALQQQRIAQLNQAIDAGWEQLRQGKYVDGETSYKKMKRKIDKIATKNSWRATYNFISSFSSCSSAITPNGKT